VSEDVAPAAAGWYPQPEAGARHAQVRYWDGTAWVGNARRTGLGGRLPRDMLGRIALILMCVGFAGTIVVPVVQSLLYGFAHVPQIVFTVAILVDLALTPAAVILSIAGLVRAHDGKFKADVSLVVIILAIVGTVILALPIALFVTGVWVLPHF
jgi:multisubunit Na+/H+ antiporter MnhF subunit